MVNPELQKRFEELFIDEYTEDQYKEFYNKKHEKQIRNHGIFFAMCMMLVFSICVGLPAYLQRDRVQQRILHGDFTTIVWINNNIAKSWFTRVDQLTDSMKTAQRLEGEKLLKLLK